MDEVSTTCPGVWLFTDDGLSAATEYLYELLDPNAKSLKRVRVHTRPAAPLAPKFEVVQVRCVYMLGHVSRYGMPSHPKPQSCASGMVGHLLLISWHGSCVLDGSLCVRSALRPTWL